MKRQTLKIFTILGALVLAAVSVNAQSEGTRVTTIPFDFNVGSKTLPAGDYVVKQNRINSDSVWLIQSKDGSDSAFFTTTSIQANKSQRKRKLVFNVYGDRYFLSEIWTNGFDTGRKLVMRRQEREFERNTLAQRLAVLSNGTVVED